MKFETKIIKALDLYKMRFSITPAIYQRGEVWSEGKKKLLIDSILRGIDIPKLYFYKTESGTYEIVDGNQRMSAITGFFADEFSVDGQVFSKLSLDKQRKVEDHPFTVIEITDATEEELSELFLRLQLGTPTNSGEKLNAINSNMKEFVKKLARSEFMTRVSIPNRRFAKEQVCAQICLNSLNDFLKKGFHDAKYEDLRDMYKSRYNFSENLPEAQRILNTFNILYEIFGEETTHIRNRAGIVSIYFLVEEFILTDKLDKKLVKEFYLKFLDELSNEVSKGIDATNRSLVAYYNRVVQGADSKTSLEARHEALKEFYQYYQRYKKIKS